MPSEPSTPVAAGDGSPVFSDAEDASGIPVTTLAQAKSAHAPIEKLRITKDVEFTSKQGDKQREAVFVETPLVASGKTILPNKAEHPVDTRVDEPDLLTDYQHPVLIEDPQRFDVKTENVLDLQQQPLLDEPHSVPETSPDTGEDLADENSPDFQQPTSRARNETELQSIYFQPTSPNQLQTENHFQ